MSGQSSVATPLGYALCLLSLLDSTGSAWGQPAAGWEVYQALRVNPRVRVVVALAPPPAARRDLGSRMSEITLIRSRVLGRLAPTDFTLTHQWEAISAVAGEVSARGLAKLMADPDVLRIDLDEGGGGHLAQSVPLVKADQVQALGFTGTGITVAVLDSGIDRDHADLRDRLVAEACFCVNSDGTGCCPDGSTQQSGAGSAEDDHGHGTNVTGIIASAGRVARVGMAPGVKIVAVKVLDRQNRFSSSAQVVSGLNWLITNHPEVKVVNMSLGTDARFTGACDSAAAFAMAFASAINTLRSNGATVFASSGNGGSASQLPAPACVANTVAVGAVYDGNLGAISIFGCTDATTAADKVTCFTDSSSRLDLVAPGAAITSTGFTGATSTFFGTSQASPHAAGAASLLLEAEPQLTPDQIETTLKTTGVSVTDAKNGLTVPRIDVLAAVNATRAGVSIATNASTYRAGQRMVVTVTTSPGISSARWYLVVALVTPVNTADNPLFVFRFSPVTELLPLQTALARSSFSDIAARPIQAIRSESFVILDLELPPGLPAGSYQWLTVLFSEDLRRTSAAAFASFAIP